MCSHTTVGSSVTNFVIFLHLECDFEESHLCGYSNQWNANVNWYVGGGGGQLLHNNINDHTYNNKTGEHCSCKGVFIPLLLDEMSKWMLFKGNKILFRIFFHNQDFILQFCSELLSVFQTLNPILKIRLSFNKSHKKAKLAFIDLLILIFLPFP